LIPGMCKQFNARWCDLPQTERQQIRKFNKICSVRRCICKEGRKNRKGKWWEWRRTSRM